MKKRLLFFDLDDTLLNTRLIRRGLIDTARRFGVPYKHAQNVYTSSKHHGIFTLNRFAEILFPGENMLIKSFKKAYNKSIVSMDGLVYPGAKPMLTKLLQRYELGILSFGDPSFQQMKIRITGLTPFFKKIIITSNPAKRDGLQQLQRMDTQTVVVDNDAKVCREARIIGLRAIQVTNKDKGKPYFKQLFIRIHAQ